jgi:acetyl/propionyl-CoA carboxylase alpha subunit
VFIGPDPDVMRTMGDRIAATRLAELVGIPVQPWSLAPERPIARARHLEVPVIADGHGNAWPLGVCDSSCRRRTEKMLEESSSPALASEQEHQIMDAAKRLAQRAGYRNAAIVEFLYEPAIRRFSFVQVTPRLHAEHPVTEAVTGLDLVKLQLHVAAGGRLDGDPPAAVGHAIEAHLCAEEPAPGFVRVPGRLAHLRLPTGPGVRIDAGVIEGDRIPRESDSMIAKLIAWGNDRDEALARLRRALADTVVVVDGATTNQGFLLGLLDHPDVRAAEIDSGLVDRLDVNGGTQPVRHGELALLQAAIELADRDATHDRRL